MQQRHDTQQNTSQNPAGPRKYYAVGGRIDLIESTTWDGFGNYYQTLSNDFLNNVLYKNISPRKRKIDYTDVDSVYLFKNKEDALIFSDLSKHNDTLDLHMFRAPIFEVEINDDSLIFEAKPLRKIQENFEHNVCNNIFENSNYPLLHNKRAQIINHCQIHKNDKQFQSFKANATIKSSHLTGYNNLGEEKFHLRTLLEKTNREFFDSSMILVFLLTFWWSVFLVPIGYGIYRFFDQKNANDRLKASVDYHQYSSLLEMHDKNRLKSEGYLFPDVNPQHSYNQVNPKVKNNLETKVTEKNQYTGVYPLKIQLKEEPVKQKLSWNQWLALSNEQLKAMGLPERPTQKNTYPIEQKIIITAFNLKNTDGTPLGINDISFKNYQDKKSIVIQIHKNAKTNWEKIQEAFKHTNETFTKSHFNLKKPDPVFFSGQSKEQQEKESKMGDFASESFVRSNIDKDEFIEKTMGLFNQKLTASKEDQVISSAPTSKLQRINWGDWWEENENEQFILSDEALKTIGLRRPTKQEKEQADDEGQGDYVTEIDIIIKTYGLTKQDGTKLNLEDVFYVVYRGSGTGLQIRVNAQENWKKILDALGTEEKKFITKFDPNKLVHFPSSSYLFSLLEEKNNPFSKKDDDSSVSNIQSDEFSNKTIELFNKKLAANDPQILVIPPIPTPTASAVSSAVTPIVFTQEKKDKEEQKQPSSGNGNTPSCIQQ